MFTVSMINRKGGCGKTSAVFHLGGCLAKNGYRVLLVDADPQASLTQGFLGPETTEKLPKLSTLAALFDDSLDPRTEELIRNTEVEGLSILPASSHLDPYNLPVPQVTGELEGDLGQFLPYVSARLQRVLVELLSEIEDYFDVVFIDCPPNLQLCSWAALLASDYVIVPLQPEDFGAQGITHVQRAIDLALARYNPRLRLLGYLVTMHQRRLRIHSIYERELRRLYGGEVFASSIPAKTDYKEAVACRLPITQFRPSSDAAMAIEVVAHEFIYRVERIAKEAPRFLYLENRIALRSAG